MKKWRIILFLAMAPLFFAGASEAKPPTRNELLIKLYSFMHGKEAEPVESARIELAGPHKLEFLRRGKKSLLLRDGKPAVVFDGTRCWRDGTIGGNDETWIFQLLFAIRPVPELFGDLKLFPRPGTEGVYTLLGRRDRYLTTALIAVDGASGRLESVTVMRDGVTRRFLPSEFRRERGRNIPGKLRIDGEEYETRRVEWNLPLDDALFRFPAE